MLQRSDGCNKFLQKYFLFTCAQFFIDKNTTLDYNFPKYKVRHMENGIIKTRVDRGHVEVDACILWCIDPRFRQALWDFEKAQKFGHIDVIKVAGGAKALAGNGATKKVLVEQVAASIRLHKPKVIVPMFHHDCGAYKPLNLKGETEDDFLRGEVVKATKSLQHFGLPIMPVIVSFDEITVL